MKYNETISNFLDKLNIRVNDKETGKVMCYNKCEINPVIARYGMYENKEFKKVCIADIIGKDRGKTRSLLEELNNLFDETGESYKKRSISMLQYDSNEIIDGLKNSFKEEPIELKEIEQGKYIVGNNGMHRVNLLRLHYLNEIKDCRDSDKIENLKQKYTIDVIVEDINVIKTYSKYILSALGENVTIEDEIDNKYLKTGNIIYSSDKDEFRIIDQKQLIDCVKIKNKEIEKNQEIKKLGVKDKYFREYIKIISNNN